VKRRLLISLLVTLGIWLVFSWPLPRHVGSAIPAGGTSGLTRPPAAPMQSGDHLQLLYHFWLFSDMLGGRTPWFHNLYEFNTGDDAGRVEPGSYYFPFSLFFAAGQALDGPALGWNLSGFLALWLTYLGTLLLARRYTADPWIAALAALLAITLPYRWINLAGGSPTGFAMMWVPWLMLGLDQAARESRVRGGLLAGLAILMASWGDTHVFYFSALLIPCWSALALLGRPQLPGRDVRGWLRLGLAFTPAAAGAGAAFLCSKLMTRHIGSTRSAAGRTLDEVRLFSPRTEGFWTWHESGVSNHIYVGFALLLVLLAVTPLLIGALRRAGPERRRAALALLLLAGAAGVAVLALGPYGPLDGRLFDGARKVIPQYVMIRQPAKVFAVLPSLLAVAAAIGVSLAAGRLRRVLLLLLALTALEFRLRFAPVLCPLAPRQDAYAAAAAVAPQRPAALVLPLWPGDSHYTSVYQYYALLHHLRLVNGYRPFVPAAYIDQIFHRFESANQGVLDDAQLDELLSRGVPAIILHEDLFPEKVSPYPVGFTLQGLLRHPRLTLLDQDGPVWAFRIERTPRADPAAPLECATLMPARHFDASRLRVSNAGQLVTRPFVTVSAPDQRWLVRARGAGDLTAQAVLDQGPNPPATRTVAGTNWQWIAFPQPAFPGQQSNHLALTRGAGVEVDYVLYTAGAWDPPAPGGRITLPAACFFHAGSTDLKTGGVSLHVGRDRPGLQLYGPKLPLEPGRYRVAVDFSSPSPAGTALGWWYVTCPEGQERAKVEITSGGTLDAPFELDTNLPLLCVLVFHGRGDLLIHAVHLTRLTDPAP
jgi:hypothetical protein